MMSKKLFIVGSDSIHVHNFIALIKDYFDDILLLTDFNHREYSVKTVAVDFRLNTNSFKNIKRIENIVTTFQPTVVHIHQANSYAFLTLLAIRNHKIKKVLTAWGSDILINPKRNLFFKLMTQYSLKSADYITADSNIVLEEASRLVSGKLKTYNINFGIEKVECMYPKENIIYSNRLHKDIYNIDKIIISFSKFIENNNNWKLVIAGRGSDTEKLKALVEKLKLSDYVEFIGFVDNKTNFEYYCKSKIYVSIPSSDSVSLSLIEAIVSSSIPFVSNLPANHEIIKNSIGFIVDDLENIPFELYSKINIDNFNKERDKIEFLFSKEYNRQRYIEIYEN